MLKYDSTAAWHIIRPLFECLEKILPEEDRKGSWAEYAKIDGVKTNEWLWDHYADRLNSLLFQVYEYTGLDPLGMLAEDWLIECGTVKDLSLDS